ncbi:Helix-turn-helix domain protein [compost metagenome]
MCPYLVNMYPYEVMIGTQLEMSTSKDVQMETSLRLREAIQAKGLKIKDAAEICGIPYRSLQNYTLGLREPGAEALRTISSRLGVSSDWLLMGEGTMFRGVSADETGVSAENMQEKAMLELFRSLGEAGKREIQSAAEEKKRLMDVEQRLKDLTEALADSKRPA